jgi:GNAT superfamily N-acetyltransferase
VHTDARLDIAQHDAAGAQARADALVAVFADVYAAKADDPFFSVERFTERLRLHQSRDGHTLVTGHVDGQLIGYAYGLPLGADTRWWSGLTEPVPPELLHETGRRTFALNEIMVLADWRRRGIARQLHDALIGHRTEERATLLVEPTNSPARAAYERWGWREFGHVRPFADSPLYTSLMLDIAAWRNEH